MTFEFSDLFLEHFGGIAQASDNTKATSIRHGGSEMGTSRDVHASKKDGMLDPEKIGGGSTNLLYDVVSSLSMQEDYQHTGRGHDDRRLTDEK